MRVIIVDSLKRALIGQGSHVAGSRRVRILGVALLFLLLFAGTIAFAHAETYSFITKWGSLGSGNGQFDYPNGVAVDGSDNVYVTDRYNNRVQKFSSSGVFITKWGGYGSGDGQFMGPISVAVDGLGNVYVTDTGNNRVQKFCKTPSDMWASDFAGNPQNVFTSGDVMYATVPAAGQTVTFYVTTHQITWSQGDSLTDVSGGTETVTLNPSGTQTIPIWPPLLILGSYDVVMDANNNGIFDEGTDLVDPVQVTSFKVIPEVPLGTAIASLSMIIAVAGFAAIKRFRPKLQPK